MFECPPHPLLCPHCQTTIYILTRLKCFTMCQNDKLTTYNLPRVKCALTELRPVLGKQIGSQFESRSQANFWRQLLWRCENGQYIERALPDQVHPASFSLSALFLYSLGQVLEGQRCLSVSLPHSMMQFLILANISAAEYFLPAKCFQYDLWANLMPFDDLKLNRLTWIHKF